jgi:hypothetical protein
MHYDYGTFAWVRDWQDEPGPYYRVNYGNGQVSEVYHGPSARKRADAARRIMPSGSPFLETRTLGTADEPGEWVRA